MAIRNRQIGWSNKSNLLYDVLRELNALKGQFAAPITTTTTTTPTPIDTLVSIDLNSKEYLFDIPYGFCSFGCWINMANDVGFPRIFSFGQYPTASQAISIESDTFYFWYNGSPIISYGLTSYLGNWVWIWVQGDSTGNVALWIDGNQVITGNASSIVSMEPVLYIGSENATSTYYDGLMAGIVFDIATIDLRIPPTSPISPGVNTVLLFGQGNDFLAQRTDQGIFGFTINSANLSYSASSPYSPANGGSLQFGV